MVGGQAVFQDEDISLPFFPLSFLRLYALVPLDNDCFRTCGPGVYFLILANLVSSSFCFDSVKNDLIRFTLDSCRLNGLVHG